MAYVTFKVCTVSRYRQHECKSVCLYALVQCITEYVANPFLKLGLCGTVELLHMGTSRPSDASSHLRGTVRFLEVYVGFRGLGCRLFGG